ncbi:GAF domain-containing protein [Plebeiibacterium sediminum]|uniref:GAF domain-containing protein n=1 Tax=Plebeiibacterium sediminum TaxID=2992112 RepID=A0AAE3M5P0_9BACT|nr:GAF domain-containing protein [Plebeiobacterium sediminum]MCW3787594.1 GAF domain-containing protein [Plebeiobacterium sediminum]
MKEGDNIKCTLSKIPFKVSLSFEYLINDIEKIASDLKHPMNLMAQQVISMLDNKPELKKAEIDLSSLDNNHEILNKLMAFVINPLVNQEELSAVFPPFAWEPFYATEYFKKLFLDPVKTNYLVSHILPEEDKMLVLVLFHAYMLILDKIYGIDLYQDKPLTFKLEDDKTKLVRFYSSRINSQYINIIPSEKHRKLSDEELKTLVNVDNDLDYWNKMIPLENYEFRGMMKIDYFDVTYDYVISQLKSDLLNRSTIITNSGFEKVKGWIKSLIENAELEVGLIGITDFKSSYNKNFIWKSIVPYEELSCEDYAGSIYEEAFVNQKIIITDDFNEQPGSKVVEAFLRRGIRSHVIVPLVVDDTVVGALEFGCAKPGNLTMIQVKRLLEVFPIFAIAINRSKTEWNDRVKAIIQKEFTAIHPTVEWKFKETVQNLLNAESCESDFRVTEPIVFNDVIPIYGASDIRGSSIERNKAIQADLTDQLMMVKDILSSDKILNDIPLVSNLFFKISQYLKSVEEGLKAGDEMAVIEFLKSEIQPILNILKERDNELRSIVDSYFAKLDPALGVYYNKRKDFEDSLTMINDHVSDILDKEQVQAQLVFPHYFEKYRTDGIEYNAYIGQSLVKKLTYNKVYLNNLRLWQLLVMIKTARKVKEIQESLKTKLDISQLILVHSAPLSIAFRQDEKKFDVDGAYNIRYEITKKRIDKALIKGSKERVTQVGKIAIIYSYAEEIEEYKRYIDFMIAQRFITNKVEDIELEDLKGASGLRALRIEVDFNKLSSEGIDKAKYEEFIGLDH